MKLKLIHESENYNGHAYIALCDRSDSQGKKICDVTHLTMRQRQSLLSLLTAAQMQTQNMSTLKNYAEKVFRTFATIH